MKYMMFSWWAWWAWGRALQPQRFPVRPLYKTACLKSGQVGKAYSPNGFQPAHVKNGQYAVEALAHA